LISIGCIAEVEGADEVTESLVSISTGVEASFGGGSVFGTLTKNSSSTPPIDLYSDTTLVTSLKPFLDVFDSKIHLLNDLIVRCLSILSLHRLKAISNSSQL